MAADESSVATELRVKHVLVPLDGSEFALQALPTARVLATRFGADLQTVSVAGADYDAERFRLQATAALGVGSGDDRAFVATNGAPAEVIAGRSQELDSCLVCLTTHGRGRLHGAVIGSVLQRLAEPMVALGPSADNPGWSPRPRSWPVPLSVPRVVACVDGSETSEQVLPLAAAWARALHMSMTILTVIEDAPPRRAWCMHRSRRAWSHPCSDDRARSKNRACGSVSPATNPPRSWVS